jgi:hypothetical protein
LAFDEAAASGAVDGGSGALFFSFSGAFVFDVADGQPQQFDNGVLGGEVPRFLVTLRSW